MGLLHRIDQSDQFPLLHYLDSYLLKHCEKSHFQIDCLLKKKKFLQRKLLNQLPYYHDNCTVEIFFNQNNKTSNNKSSNLKNSCYIKDHSCRSLFEKKNYFFEKYPCKSVHKFLCFKQRKFWLSSLKTPLCSSDLSWHQLNYFYDHVHCLTQTIDEYSALIQQNHETDESIFISQALATLESSTGKYLHIIWCPYSQKPLACLTNDKNLALLLKSEITTLLLEKSKALFQAQYFERASEMLWDLKKFHDQLLNFCAKGSLQKKFDSLLDSGKSILKTP